MNLIDYFVIQSFYYMNTTKQTAIILFAHGSRDANWRLPFEALANKLRLATPEIACELAFLELMTPDFASSVHTLVSQGIHHIRVVPVFLASGKHLKVDLPSFIAQSQQLYPHLTFEVLPPIGESNLVHDAIVQLALKTTIKISS